MTDKPKQRVSRTRENLPLFDQELRSLMGTDKLVNLHLALPTRFSDEEGFVAACSILKVDKFAIKIGKEAGSYWISKAFIVCTEVLR